MNKLIRVIKMSIIALIVPLIAFTQDVSININMTPATLQVNEIGQLEVQICNNGIPDIDILAEKLRPLISVPGESVTITGVDSSTNDGWGIFLLEGENIRIMNNIAIPAFECHSIFIGILGSSELDRRTITGTIGFNGTPTNGNDVNNDNSTTSVTVSGILPIELLRFDALPDDNHVLLEWETATEINNSHFEIQRSADGRYYQTIGQVAGHGTASEVISYSFMDNQPLNGKNHYRLKQVDFDGSFEYSPIKQVELSGQSHLIIYPNPAEIGSEVTIRGQEIRDVKVYDMLGKLFIHEEYNQPAHEVKLSSSKLPRGMYITRINNSSEKRLVIN